MMIEDQYEVGNLEDADRFSIIRMAKEAGLHRHQHNLMSNPMQVRFSYDGYEDNLMRFAALVRAEREWVDLTDDEIYEVCKDVPFVIMCPDYDKEVSRAVIAAFKEKNK